MNYLEEVATEVDDLASINELNSYIKDNEEIDSVSVENYHDIQNDADKKVTMIQLENGLSLEKVDLDELESANATTQGSSWKFVHSTDDYPTKEYGDRRFTSSHKFGGGLYPTGYAKFRIGYTLSKKKKISGRYLKTFDIHYGGSNSGLDFDAYDQLTHKWKSNSSYVSGTGYYNLKYRYLGGDTTRHVKVYNKVTVKKWNSKNVSLEQHSSAWRK
ncbi:MAG: hypothetical protein VB031_07305 [Eubacteriaceae bacterium]|nr:hypothetical protein [Eubacteriaceae bacterium]